MGCKAQKRRMAEEPRAQGSTRNEILHLLRRNSQMTASELSGVLGVGAVGVRQHLAGLCGDGLVAAVGVRRALGRPSHLYTLTAKADVLFPRCYDRVALDALGQLVACGGIEQVEQLFESRRQRLVLQYREQLQGETLEARVAALASLLTEQGYMCRWEYADDGAILLSEHNCPIDCVARLYPQACASELRLYEELLGAPLEQQATIAAGASCCCYRIAVPERCPPEPATVCS